MKPFLRLLSWALIQAFIAGQILPSPARADALRAQGSEGTSAAGLEEALAGRLARGFASRVDRVTPDGIQVAKRMTGDPVGETVWNASANTLEAPHGIAAQNAAQVERVAGWAADGLGWLRDHPVVPVISRVWDRLGDRKLAIRFLANHAMTMDFTDQDPAVRLDVTVASDLDKPEYAEGRRLLYAVGMFHEAALAAGYTPREAIHLTLGLYQGMKPEEQKALQKILRSPYVDHGDTWALFLEDADYPEFRGVDTLTLEERLETEAGPDARAKIKEVRSHRERWTSWLMSQLQVDLPYDREGFRKAMELFKRDVEGGRRAAYDVIRRFDPKVEQANAKRMSRVVREGWLPEELPYPVLLAGRASRAFDNQAMLFANAGYVLKTREIAEAGRALHEAAQGKGLVERLKAAVETAPPAAKEDLRRAAGRVEELLAYLGPGADRVRQLVFGPEKALSSTQASGALQQLRENLENFLTEASRAIEAAQEHVVAESAEGVGRKPSSASATRELSQAFNAAQGAVFDFSGKQGEVAGRLDEFRAALLQARSYAAAYSVLLQRPSPTGSINFTGNELEEKPEQEEALRKLVRLGGQNLYMSPSYTWLEEVTDVIEAAPLFIYERTITVDGKTLTVFEVDQEGLEQTIRQMADHWAANIDKTMDSEHAALAREVVVLQDDRMRQAAEALIKEGLPAEAAYRRVVRDFSEGPDEIRGLQEKVARVAAWLEREFNRRIDEVEKLIEKRWKEQRFIDRVGALRELLVSSPRAAFNEAVQASPALDARIRRFIPLALSRRRPLPAFHLLTTEAPGLVEGFIQAVLDEEMALRNVIRARKLEGKVRQRMDSYAARIRDLGGQVIREFGYEPLVEKYEAQGLSRERAIQQVIGDHLPVQRELAKLAVLAETGEAGLSAPERVDEILGDAAARAPLEREAWALVREHNRNEPGFSEEQEIYRQEMEANVRWMARRQALEELEKTHPELHALDRVERWYRDHSALARTTARRETIAAENLNGLMMDPRYAYSSGVVVETREGKLRPTGARKRYHLIYAPSRVNLGKGERKSVEVWPQWVGVTDPLAAVHAQRFYQLINFNPQVRMIQEAENLKVSENQWTAMVRAIRNVQAYFVDRLGFGDIEDLAWQFDQRDGLTGAALRQGESYQAGPTAGYCIPKDLLFKLFVATLQDDKKLSLIGIPKHLHAGVIDMMVHLAAEQRNFESVVEWETWAARQLLSEQALQARFRSGKDAREAARLLSDYIGATGGVPIFHLTKILQLLTLAGVPNPSLARLRDLHSSLWSNWAERKLTLPAEEVNRSLVFSFAREIVEAAKEAQRLNPSADIVGETLLKIHLYGTYKGDENYPSPPDVRYAWVMRAFMILAGFGKEVALSLDEEGQTLARLSWDGFRPESTQPGDMAVTRYLAKQFAKRPAFGPEDAALVERLKAAFPPHATVGDITVTVVPGVSADDLLGFSSETKNLLGNVAEQVKGILQAKGISPSQMQANAALHRDLSSWVPLTGLSADEQKVMREAVGGKIHPLILRLRGPGSDFLQDLQGQDVAVFSVSHPEVMKLDPAHLRQRMMEGRPNSALTALDYVAQGRHRVWFDREVMLWYAAGRGVDDKGEPITDWGQREERGRKAVYRAFGFGPEEYRPLLGTDLRGEVSRQERRAVAIYRALERVAGASDADLERARQDLRTQYREGFPQGQLSIEAGLAIQYEQQMLLNRRWKPRDAVIRETLVDLSTGLPVERFGEVHWLAAGGMFLLNGAPQDQQKRVLATIRKAQERLAGSAPAAAGMEENPRVKSLIQPALTVDAIRLAEKKGEAFSVKASEAVAEKAVQRRKGLALEAARLAGLKARQEGFKSVQPLASVAEIPQALNAARGQMDRIEGAGPDIQRRVGVVTGTTVQVLRALAREYVPEEKEERQKVLDQIGKLTQGRELDAAVWKKFGGSYEDHGILTRLFMLAGPERREQVLSAMELLYMTLALDKTSDFMTLPAADVDERLLLRSLASFYAETIDDHFYEYNPWALDPKRGPAFQEFYGDLGILKPEKAEELYRMSWEHHRALYAYVRRLVFTRTGARNLSEEDRGALYGKVEFGAALDRDRLAVQAIGAGAPGHYEQLWRAYLQFREMAFLRNDGFSLPVVFDQMDPDDPRILNARNRVNFAFLSSVGRTHYSRALMEAGELGENLFITRGGKMVQPPGVDGKVLQISDAHFWLTRQQYAEALFKLKGLTPDKVAAQIGADLKSGRLTPKGIRVAARFAKPVTIGSVVIHHHHYLAGAVWAAGYPGTDKSPGIYEFSYSKVEYPKAYNPPEQTGVFLPPEVDWYRADSERLGKTAAQEKIIGLIKPFVEEYGILVVKGAEESGARNFKRFDFVDAQARLLKGGEMEEMLDQAAEFIVQVSTGQDVTVQRAIIVTPLSWMTAEAARAFVDRQVNDFSVAVNLERHPKNWVYGTLRGIFSAGVPEKKDLESLTAQENRVLSHPIHLSSLQVATNVGRQGTLEVLSPDQVREQFRGVFLRDFEAAGRRVMAATARAAKRYWNEVYVPAYKAKHGGAQPREFDAAGVPYWWPRYLMLDFLPEPVWARQDGAEVPAARVVDVVPGDPQRGTEPRFMLRDREGNLFEGRVSRFIFWLLEPNVGIGLWPNYWRREEVRERAAAQREGREMNWSNIGVSDRIVLGNYLAAGRAFLAARFGDDYFRNGPQGGPDQGSSPVHPSVPAMVETAAETGTGATPAAEELRMAPPVVRLDQPPVNLKDLLSHPSTFAVVTGKTHLMEHHLYPWVVAAQGRDVNVIGVYKDWLTPDGKAKRLMALDPGANQLLEFDPPEPVSMQNAFIVELPQSAEAEEHRRLTAFLTRFGVGVVNPGGSPAQQKADSKAFLREHTPAEVEVPLSEEIPQGAFSRDLDADLRKIAAQSPAGVVIQPNYDTTEGEGVEWFASDDLEGQRSHLLKILQTTHALVSAYRGNVTYNGRPVVLRFNVVAGETTSASAVVGKRGKKIASLGRRGRTLALEEVLTHLETSQGPVAITPEVWARLQQTAVRAATAVGLPVLGMDLVLEANEGGGVRGIVLEANARPGTLIFGERVTFHPKDKWHPIRSEPAAPAGDAFWRLIGVSQAGAEEPQAVTLGAWRKILSDPVGSGFWGTLQSRYGEEETDLHRILAAYQQLVMGALANGFDPDQKVVVIVASPGRDRVFMGHTDSPGLGGFTINVATQGEILAVLQASDDGQVHLSNADPAYAGAVFPLKEIREEAKKHTDRTELLSKPRKIWDPAQWDSYLKAALAFMVAQMPGADRKIGSSGVRLYVSGVGPRALPATGGVSSSSALTGTISVGLSALFGMGFSLEQLAEVDYGEYLLGKSAGAGDKAAQLFAKRGEVGVVGSFPERFQRAVRFPRGLTLLMAESPIPRLSTSDGLEWLRQTDPGHAGAIYAWAKDDILRRFGSRAYVRAVKDLKEALADPERAAAAGLKEQERQAVLRALEDGYLRELSAGGKIERELPELAGWKNRRARYRLIYRLLKLLPEREEVQTEGLVLDVRKAALYGLAELERGAAYLLSLQAAVDAQGRGDSLEAQKYLAQILNLVRWAQDGDRATVDQRNGAFKPTPWASDPRNDVSDPTVDRWIEEAPELFSIPGGFERSIVELDEIADEANRKFGGKVAMRVAAAGMGGAMAVHAADDVVEEFTRWIESKGWKVRQVKAGAQTQVIAPPKQPLLPGQLQPEGREMVVRGEVPVTIVGDPLQLPNGSWLDPDGGTILLYPGVKIGPFGVISAGAGSRVQLGPRVVVKEHTTIEGEVSVQRDAQLWGVVRGHPAAPTILGAGTKILDPNAFIDHGVVTVPVTDGSGNSYGVSIYDARIGEEAGKGPVVIWGGTDLKKGVTVRPNSILGPFVHLGPGSEAKAAFWMGAGAGKNDSALAHRAYAGNLLGIPLYLDGTPLEDSWHAQLLERLTAFRFGRVVSSRAEKSTGAGPDSRPRLNLVMELDGRQVPVSVRGINFGDGAGVSNFKSVSGGRKAIGVVSAGTIAGVAAKVQIPAFVGPDALIDNHALVNGLQAAQPGTYVRPVGTTPEQAVRPGQVPALQGKSKGIEEFRLFLAGLRTLQTLARVSVEGLRRSAGSGKTLERAALRAEVRALKGHFDEIDAYTPKELELLANTPDADQVPALQEEAQVLRDGWAELLRVIEREKESAAGAEEAGMAEAPAVPLDAAAAARTLVILTPQTAEPGIRALASLQGPGGERVRLAAIVSSEGQEKRVRDLLAAGNLQLEEGGLINTQEGWTLADAVIALERKAKEQPGLESRVIRSIRDLRDLGLLLVPEKDRSSWQAWLDRLGLSTNL